MDIFQIKEKLKSDNYAFLKEDKNLGSNIILLTLGGSHAYGMDKEGSDLDIRGTFIIFILLPVTFNIILPCLMFLILFCFV